jgi:hypothetical protein
MLARFFVAAVMHGDRGGGVLGNVFEPGQHALQGEFAAGCNRWVECLGIPASGMGRLLSCSNTFGILSSRILQHPLNPTAGRNDSSGDPT